MSEEVKEVKVVKSKKNKIIIGIIIVVVIGAIGGFMFKGKSNSQSQSQSPQDQNKVSRSQLASRFIGEYDLDGQTLYLDSDQSATIIIESTGLEATGYWTLYGRNKDKVKIVIGSKILTCSLDDEGALHPVEYAALGLDVKFPRKKK